MRIISNLSFNFLKMNVHQIRREELISSLNQYICNDVLNIICEYSSPLLTFKQRQNCQTIKARHRYYFSFVKRYREAELLDSEDYLDTGRLTSYYTDELEREMDSKFFYIKCKFERSHDYCYGRNKWFIDALE